MKTYKNLWEKVIDLDNIKLAHKNASRGKGFYKEVQEVNNDLDNKLLNIQKMLKDKTFHTSPYYDFIKHDRTKDRKISKLPYYPDRIIHWALIQIIGPILINKMIDQTYSAIPNRGIHKCLLKLKSDLYKFPEDTIYCLKLDIYHYFESINQDILFSQYCKIFPEENIQWLIGDIIYSKDVGIPIGNYTSQYSGNFYLCDFDHYCKETLHIKFYYRYMDDITILAKSKEELWGILQKIKAYLDTLGLTLKPNYQVFPVDIRGIDFVGYKFFHKYILLRKNIYKLLRVKCNKIKSYKVLSYSQFCTINSYFGWIKWCNSYNLCIEYIYPNINKIYILE